jgi:hypothetical protein
VVCSKAVSKRDNIDIEGQAATGGFKMFPVEQAQEVVFAIQFRTRTVLGQKFLKIGRQEAGGRG